MSKTKGTKGAQPMNHTDVARALRAASPEMDELRQLRLERRVLAGTEQGVGAPSSTSQEVLPMRRVPPARLTLGVLALAAAALLGYLLRGGVAETSTSPSVEGAHFSLVRVEGTTDGVLAEGANVTTRAGERGSVEVGDVTAHLAERTNLSLESDEAQDVAMRLESGSTEFAFHPHQRGAQHLTVTTPNARVEVVGTVFTVRVDGAGTEVSVSEGTVRVVRLNGGAASLVHAGDTLLVRSVTTSARARAVESASPVVLTQAGAPTSDVAVAVRAPTAQRPPTTPRTEPARATTPSALRESPTVLAPSPTALTQAPARATVLEATATVPTVETPSAPEVTSAPGVTSAPETSAPETRAPETMRSPALALATPRRSLSRERAAAPMAATALASPRRAPRPEVVTRGPQLSQPRTPFVHERRVWGRVDDLQSNGQYEQSLPLLIAIENEGAPADRAEALYHRARTLDVALHRPAQAVELYRRYLEAHPTGVRAREAEQRIRMIEHQ